MDIIEMHQMFRQYAQQMGMQNVRAILPEQIDLLLNNSISDTINQIITQNVGVTNDRVVTDNSKIGQVNALRALYKVKLITDFSGVFTAGSETYIRKYNTDTAKLGLATKSGEVYTDNYLYLVDMSISYKNNSTFKSSLFPVRLIDDIYLADVLNDFVLSPRLRSPIAVVYNNTLDVYIDKLKNGALPEGLIPNEFRLSYIAKPAKVSFNEDISGTNVNCDMPTYMHVDIVKHAVDLYRIALNGSLQTVQQQEAQQQRENLRNNYRNDAGGQPVNNNQ